MRAIVAEEFGGYQNLKVADIPKPAVSDGRVLVRMTAAGVTPLDHTRALRLPTTPSIGERISV
jgi:NADPH:quinone reductase